jgi:hypothetical protein
MTKCKRVFFAIATISVCVLSFAVSPAYALSLSVQPAIVRVSVAAGGEWRGELVLSNPSDEPLVATLGSFNSAPPVREGAPAVPLTDESANERELSLAGWMRYPRSVTVDAGQSTRVPLTIEVPDYAAGGVHYGIITFTPAGAEAGVAPTLAAGIALEVVGQDNRALALQSFSFRRLLARFPVSFSLRLRNTGTTVAMVGGRVTVTDILRGSATDAAVPVQGEGRYLVPAAVGEYGVEFPEGSWGLYLASLALASGTETIEESGYFAVFPWPILVALGGAMLLASFGTAASIRALRKRLSTRR